MTNKGHHFWVVPLFFSGICIFGYGCATTPKTDDQSSSDDENFTSELFRSVRFDGSIGNEAIDKGENEPEKGNLVGSDSKPGITGEPKPSPNQLSNSTKQGNPIVPRKEGEVDLDPELSSKVEDRADPSSSRGSLPREKDGDKPDSRSPSKEDAEGGAVSDSGNTPEKIFSEPGGDDSVSHSPGSSTAPGRDKDEDKRGVDNSGSSANLVAPSDSPGPLLPPGLPETGELPGTFHPKPSDGKPGVSAPTDSAAAPESGSKKTDPVDDLVTPSLPGTISPELSEVLGEGADPKPVVTDGAREGVDVPNDLDAKSVGFATPLPGESSLPGSLPAQVGFGDRRSSRDEEPPAGFKVALSGEEEVVVPPPRSGSTPSVRFFDRMNAGGNRPEGGNAKTLGFSDRRPNSRFLQRRIESSSKNVFQPSGKPNDYNSLKNFLSNRNKFAPGGSGGVPSTGNYPEAEKFLESIDSSKNDETSILRDHGTYSDDARYQNALEWLRSRGQGDGLQD